MPVVGITAEDVAVKSTPSNANVLPQTAGEALTQGQAVYLSDSDGKYYKAQNDTATKAAAVGVAVTPAAADGTVMVAFPPCDLDLGATLTQGKLYFVSSTAGGFEEESDLASTELITLLGIAEDASTLKLDIIASGIPKP